MHKRTTRTRNFRDHKGCSLFRATNFTSLMRLTVFFSWLFGFFPFNYKSEEYVFSKKKFAYSIIAICVHLSFQIYNFLFTNIFDTDNFITRSMAENFFLLLDGTLPLLLFVSPLTMATMFEQLSKLSRTLSRTDFNAIAKVIHAIYSINVVYYAVLIIYYMLLDETPPLPQFLNLYLALSSTMPVLCYLSCVRVLGACLKKLNKNLKRLNGASPCLRIELAEKQLSRRESTMLLTKVKYFEEMHEKISDAIEHLNRLFRTVNIFFTISTFLSVTFNLYDLLETYYITGTVGSTTELLFVFVALSFTAVKFGIFCEVVWFCQTATNDAAEITITIHNCVIYCADDTVKRELKYFALQVMHRDITFTTKAFDINGKLLSQILSGIFMYVMILYQFLMTTNCTN
ncbi:uncharacterized protein LOC144478849 [Augochlora pura]